ncbi:homoserine kinase [Nocardioides sp. R-C-SC26]|uniref:homoserine kinase n=1 Tax=Nocardioides sp. R-C-SC26 TaxID=2870414 RepID=UPI001E35CAFA|nr:homoserine kinase [Nocardioides sp. R-C-SC26]
MVAGPVRVSVPATSANLGPGFDTLGLALDLRDELEAEVLDAGLVVEVEGEGAGAVPLDDRHLVVRSMNVAFDALGARPTGLRLRCRNALPHARGLGSSSAAIVGGLALARALVVGGRDRLDDAALLDLAAGIEGHPDNVAPALYGGFVISGTHASGAGDTGHSYFAVPSPVMPGLGVVVFVPPDGVETKAARGLLPDVVPHADAAANAGRAALLVAALGGHPDQLVCATQDLLHQEYRRPAMPASLALIDDLRARGVPAVVSGAGPTVLAFTHPELAVDAGALLAACPAGWRALALAVCDGVRDEHGPANPR